MPVEEIKLKCPLQPKDSGTDIKNLNLSVYNHIFESILEGGHVECRAYNRYYEDRCNYVENGKRYLIPFDTITFYVGRDEHARKAVVTVDDITCDGEAIYFKLGKIIEKRNA